MGIKGVLYDLRKENENSVSEFNIDDPFSHLESLKDKEFVLIVDFQTLRHFYYNEFVFGGELSLFKEQWEKNFEKLNNMKNITKVILVDDGASVVEKVDTRVDRKKNLITRLGENAHHGFYVNSHLPPPILLPFLQLFTLEVSKKYEKFEFRCSVLDADNLILGYSHFYSSSEKSKSSVYILTCDTDFLCHKEIINSELINVFYFFYDYRRNKTIRITFFSDTPEIKNWLKKNQESFILRAIQWSDSVRMNNIVKSLEYNELMENKLDTSSVEGFEKSLNVYFEKKLFLDEKVFSMLLFDRIKDIIREYTVLPKLESLLVSNAQQIPENSLYFKDFERNLERFRKGEYFSGDLVDILMTKVCFSPISFQMINAYDPFRNLKERMLELLFISTNPKIIGGGGDNDKVKQPLLLEVKSFNHHYLSYIPFERKIELKYFENSEAAFGSQENRKKMFYEIFGSSDVSQDLRSLLLNFIISYSRKGTKIYNFTLKMLEENVHPLYNKNIRFSRERFFSNSYSIQFCSWYTEGLFYMFHISRMLDFKIDKQLLELMGSYSGRAYFTLFKDWNYKRMI